MRKTAKWVRTNALVSILVLVSILALMDVALQLLPLTTDKKPSNRRKI
jgi:hypothetical protein